MRRKPTWNDFKEGMPKELMRVYGLDQKGLENAQRRLCEGAKQGDLVKEYESFYRRNRRDA